jgi:hypothetical protein
MINRPNRLLDLMVLWGHDHKIFTKLGILIRANALETQIC